MQKGLKTCQDSPSCMEAQRVMRRRTLALVPIADERGSAESLFCAQLQPCCMSHCCCVSAGVAALSLLYTSPSHDVTLKAPPTAAFFCAASLRPQGAQTCDTFREYLMLRSLSGMPLSPVERDLRLQFAFDVDTKQFEHIVLCDVISCHYTRGFESKKVLKCRGGVDALDVWKYRQKGRGNGWHHCLVEDRCSGDI